MRFIAFEGLDGSGKSTLIKGLSAALTRAGTSFVLTREPGGTPLGEEIRTLLLRTDGEAPTPRTEALLYQASRAQHVDKVIDPALKRGDWVLCDRFTASSAAFQAGGREISEGDIDWLNHFSTAGRAPDLNVLLDLSVEESLKRLQGRDQEIDRFERESSAFHQKVRDAYLKISGAQPARWLVLSSAQKSEDLVQLMLSSLKERGWLA